MSSTSVVASKVGVDIVVVNYRTPHDLAALLHSIDQHPPISDYSLVIVNVTPDAQSTIIAEETVHQGRTLDRNRSSAQIVTFNTNVGYNRAANAGGALGTHQYIAVLNADVVVPDQGFDMCRLALRLHPEVGLLGPRQIDDQRRLTAAGIFNDKHRGWRELDTGQYQDTRLDASMIAGSIVFQRRTVWELLTQCDATYASDRAGPGPWLETARHYFGDKWLAAHCQAHGWSCCYFGQSTWTHKWHQASKVGGYGEQNMKHDEDQYLQALSIHQSLR